MNSVRVGFARRMAREVLKQNDIFEPPVDVHSIAASEKLCIQLVASWPEEVSGLLLREERLIGVNARHSKVRQRFSLAHELGHWFMRHDFPWHEEEVTIDNPPSSRKYEKHPMEGEADEFAGELLAPRSMLKDALKRTRDAGELAAAFHMSQDAIWVRLVRHNLI